MRALIVAADRGISQLLRDELEECAWIADICMPGSLLVHASRGRYDIVLLHACEPFEAHQACRRMRDEGIWTPVILVSDGSNAADVAVAGLDAGADGFVIEPHGGELIALMKAVTRDRPDPRNRILTLGDIRVDSSARTVTRQGRTIDLTPREFALLRFLMSNAGVVVSRAAILDAVWGLDYFGTSNVVDVYVGYLRRKIEKPFGSRVIRAVRGVGYVLDATESLADDMVDLRRQQDMTTPLMERSAG